jgi:hypothetical protein
MKKKKKTAKKVSKKTSKKKKKTAKKVSKKTSKKKSTTPAEPEDDDATGESMGDVDGQLDAMFEDSWDGIPAKEFSDIPPATYQTRVVAGVLNNAKSSGRFQCSWEAVILDGEQRGRHLFKHDGLDEEQSRAYFKGTLSTLGYEIPSDKEGLKETLQEIVDAPTYVVARVTARKRKDQESGEVVTRTNVRFVRALDSDDVTDDLEEEELQSFLEGYEPGDELTVDEPSDAGGEEEAFDIQYEKGDRVTKDFDGEDFGGVVTKVKGTKATVKFDDGEIVACEFEELQPEAGEDADAGGGSDAGEDPDAGEEPSCSLKEGVEVTDAQTKVINKLAKKLGFNEADYETWEALLCELGDYCGLSGEFKTVKDLVTQAQKASS